MEEYYVSKEAILGSTIDKLSMICLGTVEEKKIGMASMAVILKILMPIDVKSEEDEATAILIVMLSKMTDLMEIEAQALQMLKMKLNTKMFNDIASIDYSHVHRDEAFLYAHAPVLLPVMKVAGVDSLEVSFAELDGLNKEVQNKK